MRRFDRYIFKIPFTYRLGNDSTEFTEETKNISQGGLCFDTKTKLKPGTVVNVSLLDGGPDFESEAIVSWRRRIWFRYETGLSFHNYDAQHSAQMIEQLCDIQLYRDRAEETERRTLSFKEAAREWKKNRSS